VVDNFGLGSFCHSSSHYRWEEILERNELNKMLKKNLTSNGIDSNDFLKDIKVIKRAPSGRVIELELVFGDRIVSLKYDQIRKILRGENGEMLRSTLFRIIIEKNQSGDIVTVRLVGGGNGHGVGMCQWGAIGMANAGYRFQEILKHYYRGTDLKSAY